MRRGWMVVAGVVVLCGGLGPVLTGCAVTEEFQREFFDRRTVNLTDSSYAAVDALTQQLRPHVSPATPLRVGELTDVATPGETTPFGRHVSTQIGSRLVQLGYNVRSAPLPPAMIPPATGASIPAQTSGAPQKLQTGSMAPGNPQGETIVTGTYTRMKDHIIIALRVVQGEQGRMVGAYDYTIPMTREMREMSMSAAERAERKALMQTTHPETPHTVNP